MTRVLALAILVAFASSPVTADAHKHRVAHKRQVFEASCPNPLLGKDSNGTVQNFATFNDASNNCVGISQADQARQYNATLQSSATANGNGTALSTTGLAGGTMTVNCASCSGGTTVNFQAQEDGSNFVNIQGYPIGGGAAAPSTQASGVTVWQFNLAGVQQIRAPISGYGSGTVTVTMHAISVPVDYVTHTVFQGGVWASNTSQVNNTTTSTGAGAAGAGSQRVSVAQDSTTVAG